MPVLPSPDSASRFGETWLDPAAGSGSVPLDDSLTSLHWLQNFSILSAEPERLAGTGPDSPSSQHHLLLRRLGFPRTGTDSPSSPPAGDTAAAAGTPRYPGSSQTSAAPPRFCPVQTGPQLELDYRNNPTVKPPFSYASLICMAMQASRRPKVTLATIYSWITDNFCYYRHAEPSWQNSIRHNLSLNKCFRKVPRQKDEPGKGGFWQIDPQYADMFVNGIFKRRRMSASQYGGGGAAARPSRLAQFVPSSCPDQAGARRRQLPPSDRSELQRPTQSPLLAMEANKPDVLKGDFDLGSVFDDVLGGGCSTFEDLDLNSALSSLGCEVEASMMGRQQAAGLGRWGGGADLTHYPACSYLDLSGTGPAPDLEQDRLQQLDGSAPLFGEPPAALQSWEEVKEEAQVIPLTLDPGFGLYEGFFTEMQQWERVDSYL